MDTFTFPGFPLLVFLSFDWPANTISGALFSVIFVFFVA